MLIRTLHDQNLSEGNVFQTSIVEVSRAHILFHCIISVVGRLGVVDIARRHRLDGSGIESRCGRDFGARPDRPWGPPSLLYNGYPVSFLRGKQPRRGADHPSPCIADVQTEYSYIATPTLSACTGCYGETFTFNNSNNIPQ